MLVQSGATYARSSQAINTECAGGASDPKALLWWRSRHGLARLVVSLCRLLCGVRGCEESSDSYFTRRTGNMLTSLQS